MNIAYLVSISLLCIGASKYSGQSIEFYMSIFILSFLISSKFISSLFSSLSFARSSKEKFSIQKITEICMVAE